ncbi:MAG TPA: trypsin-like serine protease [Clostridia bacterium]|nr:trypsin-like serine protease [Clostridia bacterium]
MKRLVLAIIFCCLLLNSAEVALATGVSVYVDGVRLNLPLEPVIESGTTLVPMRPIFEALGAEVSWDSLNNEVKAIKGNTTIILPVGKKVAIINGYIHNLTVPSKIVNHYTLVPLRFISEAFGGEVDWDEASKVITINTEANRKESKSLLSLTDLAKKAQYVVMIMTYDSKEILTATASGVIIGPNGLVVTNYHVLEGANKAVVVNDKEEFFPVEGVLAYDGERDLALLKVQADLPYVTLGDSEDVQIGDEVISIGSPLGLKNTVANGVVSNLIEMEKQPFIQTTAPISEGSSGGALFNTQGELIGITTAFVSLGQGINLAIPVNDLKPLANNLADVPIGLEEMFPVGFPFYDVITDVNDLVSYLNDNHSEWNSDKTSIRFTYLAAENNLYDFEVDAIINPYDYGNWLETDNDDRLAIVGQILKDIDANVDLSKSFKVVFFYQDYWPFYPSSFAEHEVSLAPGGESWLVTHILAQGYTSGDEMKWEVFY